MVLLKASYLPHIQQQEPLQIDIYLTASFLNESFEHPEKTQRLKGRPPLFPIPFMHLLCFLKRFLSTSYRQTSQIAQLIFEPFEKIQIPSYVQIARRDQVFDVSLIPEEVSLDLFRLELLVSSTRLKIGSPFLSNKVLRKFRDWEKIQLHFDRQTKKLLKKRHVTSSVEMDRLCSPHAHLRKKIVKEVLSLED